MMFFGYTSHYGGAVGWRPDKPGQRTLDPFALNLALALSSLTSRHNSMQEQEQEQDKEKDCGRKGRADVYWRRRNRVWPLPEGVVTTMPIAFVEYGAGLLLQESKFDRVACCSRESWANKGQDNDAFEPSSAIVIAGLGGMS